MAYTKNFAGSQPLTFGFSYEILKYVLHNLAFRIVLKILGQVDTTHCLFKLNGLISTLEPTKIESVKDIMQYRFLKYMPLDPIQNCISVGKME